MNPSIAARVNVLGGQLEMCSTNPMTGFFRNGFCDTSRYDGGSHTVAAIVTDEFLEFSAQRGNDLRQQGTMIGGSGNGSFFPGLTGGCKWCLCASRWLEAYEARGIYGDKIVPSVILESSHTEALKTISLEQLKQYAASLPDHNKDEL